MGRRTVADGEPLGGRRGGEPLGIKVEFVWGINFQPAGRSAWLWHIRDLEKSEKRRFNVVGEMHQDEKVHSYRPSLSLQLTHLSDTKSPGAAREIWKRRKKAPSHPPLRPP